MNQSEKYIENLLKEINDLGHLLTQIKSETALLMHQQKIQSMYEKFIFIKLTQTEKLNMNHLTKEYNNPIINDLNEDIIQNKSIEIIDENLEIDSKNIENDNKPIEIVEEKEIEVLEQKKISKINIINQKKYPEIQLNINDKIAFIAKLFGDIDRCHAAMNALNHLQNKHDSMLLFNELSIKLDWKGKEEFSDRLKELIENRFN